MHNLYISLRRFLIFRAPKTSVTQSSHVCRRFVAELKLCDEFARAMLTV